MNGSGFLEYAVRLFFAKQLQGYCKGALNDYSIIANITITRVVFQVQRLGQKESLLFW